MRKKTYVQLQSKYMNSTLTNKMTVYKCEKKKHWNARDAEQTIWKYIKTKRPTLSCINVWETTGYLIIKSNVFLIKLVRTEQITFAREKKLRTFSVFDESNPQCSDNVDITCHSSGLIPRSLLWINKIHFTQCFIQR